jgi:hypothetical protein
MYGHDFFKEMRLKKPSWPDLRFEGGDSGRTTALVRLKQLDDLAARA